MGYGILHTPTSKKERNIFMPSFDKTPKLALPKGTIEPMKPIRGDMCPFCKAQRIELFSFNGYPQDYSQAFRALCRAQAR